MIFKPKKTAAESAPGRHVMRSRDRVENGSASSGDDGNPLARRFHSDDEPETIDLQQPSGFPAGAENPEPETSDSTPDVAPSGSLRLISYAPETGKFYLHPAKDGTPTKLAGAPVTAPTELRPGDEIQIQTARFIFQG